MKFLDMRYNNEYIIAMGDTIDCVPLINFLINKHGRLIIPCYRHYRNNILSFFPKDINAEIIPINSFDDYQYYHKSRIVLEINPKRHDEPLDYRHFEIATVYEEAGLPYKDRHKWNTIDKKRVNQLPIPSYPYAFVPEGGSTNAYKIDRELIGDGLELIIPPQDGMMLAYADIIASAKEIHCHATAYQRLVDKLPTSGELYLHHYARATNIKPENYVKYGVNEKKWTQLI